MADRMRVCAAVIRDNAILMVRHVHDGRSYWTLPGGGVEPGEAPVQAVVRELREETRLEGRVSRLLFEVDYSDGPEACYLVDVEPGARVQRGYDPELPADGQMIVDVAWHPLADMADDVQVRRVIAALAM